MGPYQELLELCVVSKQHSLETGGEMWARLVGTVSCLLSGSLTLACTSTLVPSARAKRSLLFPVHDHYQAQAKAGSVCLDLEIRYTQAALTEATLCQC